MMKTLLVLVVVCLVTCSATPIDQEKKWKPIAPTEATVAEITGTTTQWETNDQENHTALCYMAPKTIDAIWALFKLKRCLKQKKTMSKRVKRSIDEKSTSFLLKTDMEKLMEHIKWMADETKKQHKETSIETTTVWKAEETSTYKAEESTPWKSTIATEKMETKLSCPAGKKVKIIKATLTNKDFETKFPDCWNTKMDHSDWFTEMQEPCTESHRTTKMTSQWCNKKSECMINWENMFSGVCDCTIKKYLDVTWMCTGYMSEIVEEEKKTRSKRSLHYRNDKNQMKLERKFRNRIARLEGIDKVIDYYFNGQAMKDANPGPFGLLNGEYGGDYYQNDYYGGYGGGYY